MNEIWATLIGAFLCCGSPLIAFFAGMYYKANGLPFEIKWRGGRDDEES